MRRPVLFQVGIIGAVPLAAPFFAISTRGRNFLIGRPLRRVENRALLPDARWRSGQSQFPIHFEPHRILALDAIPCPREDAEPLGWDRLIA